MSELDPTDEDRNAYIESLFDALEKSKAVRSHLEDIIQSLHANLEQERNNRERVEAELVRLQEHTLYLKEAQQDEIEELEETYKSNTNAVKRVVELETELEEMKMKFKHLKDINKEKIMQSNNEDIKNKQIISELEKENKMLNNMLHEFKSKESQAAYQAKVIQELLQQQSDNKKTIDQLQDKICSLKKNLKSSKEGKEYNNIIFNTSNLLASNNSVQHASNGRVGQMTSRVSSSECSAPSNSECDESLAVNVPRRFISKLWKNFINVCKDKYLFLNSEISSFYKNREYCMISLDKSNSFLGIKSPNVYKEPILCFSQLLPGIFKINSDYTLTFASTNSPYVGYKLTSDKYFFNSILSKNPSKEPIIFQDDESGCCLLRVASRNLYFGIINDCFSNSNNFSGLTRRYNYTPFNSNNFIKNSNYSYSSKANESSFDTESTPNSPDRIFPFTSANEKSTAAPHVSNTAFIPENAKLGFVSRDKAAKFRLVSLEEYLNSQAKKEAQYMMDANKIDQVEFGRNGPSDWVIIPEITTYTLAYSAA